MTKILLSTHAGHRAGWVSGHLLTCYRQYERVLRTTASGRRYDCVSLIERDGSGLIYVAELTEAGSRARRSVRRCDFGPRNNA